MMSTDYFKLHIYNESVISRLHLNDDSKLPYITNLNHLYVTMNTTTYNFYNRHLINLERNTRVNNFKKCQQIMLKKLISN